MIAILDRERRAVRKTLDLLKKERGALLAARFDLLPGLADALVVAAGTLEQLSVPEEDLRRIQDLAQQNQALAQASRRGLVAAHELLVRNSETALTTYSKAGARQQVDGAAATRDRRS